MSDRVLKWTVEVDNSSHKVEGVPLFAGTQDPMKYDEVTVWTGVGDNPEVRYLQVFGTGQPLPDGAEYVWTVICAGGALVWHVFDVTDVVNG